MTVSMLAAPAVSHQALLPVLDPAVHASREAHDATRAHTDTVLACQHLPAEVYQYAPHLSQATATVAAASRTLTAATCLATVDPTPDNLHALHSATAELSGATAALRYQVAALATAAGWYATPAALAPAMSNPNAGPQL